MPIDPSIALQLRPLELPNPLAQFAQVQQIRGAQQQNALADLVMGEKQREIAATEAVNNVYRAAGDPSAPDYRARLLSGLATAGQGARIPGLQKTFIETDDKLADTKKKTAETGKIETETTGMKFEQWDKKRQIAIADIAAFTTPEQALASLNQHAAKGDIPQEQAELIRKTIPTDPAQFPKWQIGMLQRIMSPEKAAGYIAPDANTVANNQTSIATNAATNATSRANNAATVSASRENAAATRDMAKATRDAATVQRDQATEMKLADDYRAQSKGFKEASDAYKQINATLDQANKSPAATLAAATKFMKLLDPGSVVRESELGMALAASGVIDRATNYFNTLKSGRTLTKSQVEDFRSITKQIYGAAQRAQVELDDNYRAQAKSYGLRPENVIQKLGQDDADGGQPAAKPTVRNW